MGTRLQKCMDQLMEKPEVMASVCADEQGLTISERNTSNHETVSAAARDILELAKKLDQNAIETPTIVLKSNDSNIVIAQDASVIVVLQEKCNT